MSVRLDIIAALLIGCGSTAPSPEPIAIAPPPSAPREAAPVVEVVPPPIDPAEVPCFAHGVASGRYADPAEPELVVAVVDGCVGVVYGGRAELPSADGAFAVMLRASLAGARRVLAVSGADLTVRSESWESDRSVPPMVSPAAALRRTGDVPRLEEALFEGDDAVRAAAIAAALGRQDELAPLLVRYLETFGAIEDPTVGFLVRGATATELVAALPALTFHDAHCREAGDRIEVTMSPTQRAAVLATFLERTLGAPDGCTGLGQVGEALVPRGAASCGGEAGCLSEAETELLFMRLVDLALTRAGTDLARRQILDLARSLVYPVDPAFLRAAVARSACDEQVLLLGYLDGAGNAPGAEEIASVYGPPIHGGLCDRARDEAIVLLASRAASSATEATWQLLFEGVSGPHGEVLRGRVARAIEWSPPSGCVHGLNDTNPTGARVAAAVGLSVCP